MNEVDNSNLVNLIKKALQEKNLTISELGKRTGIQQSYLSKIINDKKLIPTVGNIRKIADALDLKYEYLLYLAGHLDLSSISQITMPITKKDFISAIISLNDLEEYQIKMISEYLIENRDSLNEVLNSNILPVLIDTFKNDFIVPYPYVERQINFKKETIYDESNYEYLTTVRENTQEYGNNSRNDVLPVISNFDKSGNPYISKRNYPILWDEYLNDKPNYWFMHLNEYGLMYLVSTISEPIDGSTILFGFEENICLGYYYESKFSNGATVSTITLQKVFGDKIKDMCIDRGKIIQAYEKGIHLNNLVIYAVVYAEAKYLSPETRRIISWD